MPGPPPKPPGQRRRRNKGPKSQTLRVNAANAANVSTKVPVLPDSELLLEETRAWWVTVWSSPMAAVYLEADVPVLARLAGLVDRVHRGESGARLLTEIRSLEDRFGLSPLARRRLQWEVERATGSAPPAGEEEDERWLRVVSD